MAKKTNGKRRAGTRAKTGAEPAAKTPSTESSTKLNPSIEPKPRRNRAKTAASTSRANSTSQPNSQQQPKRKKRVSIGEALRGFGLDEHKFAEAFAAAGSGSDDRDSKSRGENKAALDYLKEWSRHLEPPRAVEREASDRAVPFMLVHHMPRPVRGPAAENKKKKAENRNVTPAEDESRICRSGNSDE